MNEFTTQQQWDIFGEFIQKKLDVGEPSPHMKIVGYLSKDMPLKERFWRAGCYGVPYSIITAEVLWTEWPWERVKKDPAGLKQWIFDNWKNIHTRTERRCVRTPEKFSECLLGYGMWMISTLDGVLDITKGMPNEAAYDTWWESIATVKYMGRYINIRMLDLFHRYCGVEAHLYDIRSIGGWSPKKMLALLFPDDRDALLAKGKAGDELANQLATDSMYKYREDYGLDIDFYIYAAMLCEYRVAYEGSHQYPGRTHDQEIEYFNKKGQVWLDQGFRFKMFEARKALFPNECLGELNSWSGIRDDLSRSMRENGYVWSDVEFDYGKTVDLADPVRREPVV